MGGPAAYDVSVVTALRKDRAFVAQCAATPGYAARARHDHKLSVQYRDRLPGALLHPLVVEVGGRWHSSVPPLLRRFAREHVQRGTAVGERYTSGAEALVLARWAARLSAALLRGNAAVHRRAGYSPPARVAEDALPAGPLAHLVPEGESAYELFVS